MSVTLFDMRQKAPSTPLALAFDTIIRTEPMLSQLGWDSVAVDQQAYRRAQGTSTAVHQNPDSTFSAGNDEVFDTLIAHIRPIGGQIQMPLIGSNSGTLSDHVKSKTRAVTHRFMNSFINGHFGETVTFSPTLTANDGATAGPYWDLTTRGDGGVFRVVIAGAVTTSVVDFKRFGDTDYGLVDGAAAADLQASGDAVYHFASENPNYWIEIDLDVSDILVQFAADGTYYVTASITTTNSQFDGLLYLTDGTDSYLDTASAAAEAFDLYMLDSLGLACNSGGSRKVYLMAERTYASFLSEMRGLGGITWMDVAGKQVASYNGVPVFTSSYVPITRTYAATGNCAPIFMIDLEEGVRGLYRSGNGSAEYDGKSYGGLYIRNLGEMEGSENEIIRLSWHVGLEHLNLPGCVMMDGITN